MPDFLMFALASFLAIPNSQAIYPELVLVQADSGPTKAGLYVTELKCPSSNESDIVVLQMNTKGQLRRTKAIIADGIPTRITIEVAERGEPFEVAFPKGNDFNASQRQAVEKGATTFLVDIYREVCIGEDGKRVDFSKKIAKNKEALANH